jgi:hypothetical protein
LGARLGSSAVGLSARLSLDGKYLFFQSQRTGSDPNRSLYWMSADFIAGLADRP